MPNQFIFGKGVNPGRLRREIIDNPDITPIFTTMRTSSGVLTAVEINFATNLSAAEETTLSGIVSAHIPTPIKEFITHVNTLNGVSGAITLNVAENATVVGQQLNDLSGTLDITTGIPTASGELLAQNATDVVTLSGLFTGGGGVFGSGLTHIEDDSTFVTSSNNFQEALLLTTPSLETGDYYISWSFESFVEDNDDFRETHRIRLDDNELLGIHTIGHDDKEDWKQESGFAVRTLTAGVHTIDIDIRRGSDKSTGIRRRRLIIWRVS